MKKQNCFSFSNGKLVYFEGNSFNQHEIKSEHNNQPLEKADKEMKSEVGATALGLIQKYKELFKDGQTQEKVNTFIAVGEKMIKEMNMKPAELVILRDSGKYKEPYPVKGFGLDGDPSKVHFNFIINDKAQIEPVTMMEMHTYDK